MDTDCLVSRLFSALLSRFTVEDVYDHSIHTYIPNEVLRPLSCVNKVLGIVIVRICTLCTLLGREGTRVREREGWREQQTFKKMLESLYSSALAPVISATSCREITFA